MTKSIKTGTSSISWATSSHPSDRGADPRTRETLLIIGLEIQIRNIENVLFFFCSLFFYCFPRFIFSLNFFFLISLFCLLRALFCIFFACFCKSPLRLCVEVLSLEFLVNESGCFFGFAAFIDTSQISVAGFCINSAT